jgi:hypothetical protein
MRFAALAIAAAAVIAGAASGCGGGSTASQSEKSQAVGQAVIAFRDAQQSGKDLSAGPCISESLPGASDWAADIAHDPRQAVDDDPANQCTSYRQGQTHHFVELTPQGDLIRTQ